MNDISLKDSWVLLKELGMDKLLGITDDEFMFLAGLPENMNEDEMVIQLEAYREYKNTKREK